MTRVLAVLSGARGGLSLDPGNQVTVDRVPRLPQQLAPNEVDVVVFDADAGDGWPVDNALAAAAVCRDRCALLVLCTAPADVRVLEQRLAGALVWPVVRDALLPGELERLVHGLAAKWRAGSISQH